jgi:6-phosphogluconolactonase
VSAVRIETYPSAEDLAGGVAERIAGLVNAAGDRVTIGLAGGSTPRTTYQSLTEMGLDWDKTDLWLSDERWVPHDHERSNGRMVVETLLGSAEPRLHRPIWNVNLEASDSAAHYEATIRALHHDHRPDLVHLGLGADGHTASLFPGTRALEATWRWVVANPIDGETRITSTYPLLWQAGTLLVQVSGSDKAVAVRNSLDGNTPASRLVEGDAEVEWHLDEDAAALIS